MKRLFGILFALFYAWCGFTGRALAQPAEAQSTQAQSTQAPPVAPVATVTHKFFEPKEGKGVTFYTLPGGEITFYGVLDVSFDVTTKGISDLRDSNGNGPVGNVGWMPAIGTNLSYLGARGFQKLGDVFSFVYQLETQLDIAASSGLSESNSNKSDVVKGGLTSRNSFIGLSTRWGSLKFGKTDAPYKLSTNPRMNPFSGMIGDYSVVMGNTGGDNRVEFGTRLDHSIWYESPKIYGFNFAVLFSPGQNRSTASDNLPSGGADCTGGNIPGSGGTGTPGGAPISCNDGSFGNALSAALTYEYKWLYVATAYERHWKVNRNSDIYGIYGYPLPAPVSNYDALDVADEDAFKIGAQVLLPTGTTIGGFFEDFHRYVAQELQFQNERQRLGFWLTVSQQLGEADSVHVGWAHAYKSPGDPGQHNTAVTDVGNGGMAGGLDADNSANMVTAAIKHSFGHGVLVYLAWAYTINNQFAHYDLGAGGRSLTTDCHDAGLPASGDVNSNPHCWAGGKLMGFSLGMNARF
jgi:predicted porin